MPPSSPRPVFGIVSPLSAGCVLIHSYVSPLATCHAISPVFMLYAVMRPYGGLTSGSPCGPIPQGPRPTPGPSTGMPPRPRPPPPPPRAAAPAPPPPPAAPRPAAPPRPPSGSPAPPPPMYVMSDRSPPGWSELIAMLVTDGTYNMLVSGSNAAPCQSAAPCEAGICSVPRRPSVPATIGGV